jgi:hypothetical protein
MLDELAGTKYFSKFEFGMRSGYRMVPHDEQTTTYKLIMGNLVWSCFIWINECTSNI